MGVRYRKDRAKWLVDSIVDGKRVAKMFDTQADACEYETNLKNKRPIVIKEQANSFKLAVLKYFEQSSLYRMSAHKEKHYFSALFNYLQSKQVSRIDHVTLDMLLEFQSQVFKRGCKKSTVNRYFITYKTFFKCCVDWGLIEKSPAEKLKVFSVSKNIITRKMWSDQQISEVIGKADGWLKEFLVVVSHTGMRPIEVTRLTWSDHIDLPRGLIKAVTFKGIGRQHDRWIPMTVDLKLMLTRRRAKIDTKYVFQSTHSTGPRTVDSIGQQLKDLNRGTPLEGYTMYGMRHSFATRSLESGVDLESLRQLMGHENLSTTQVYLHYTQDHLKDAMALVDRKRNLQPTLPPKCNQDS